MVAVCVCVCVCVVGCRLGPAVVSAVQQSTGETRYAFIYIACMLIIPATLLLFVVDEKAGRHAAIAFAEKRLKKLKAQTSGLELAEAADGSE